MFPEKHSTKQIEDTVAWCHDTDGETVRLSVLGDMPSHRELVEMAKRVECPVLVIHGTNDKITPYVDGNRPATARRAGKRRVAGRPARGLLRCRG